MGSLEFVLLGECLDLLMLFWLGFAFMASGLSLIHSCEIV